MKNVLAIDYVEIHVFSYSSALSQQLQNIPAKAFDWPCLNWNPRR